MKICDINKDCVPLEPTNFRRKPRRQTTEFPDFKFEFVKQLNKSLQFYKDISNR